MMDTFYPYRYNGGRMIQPKQMPTRTKYTVFAILLALIVNDAVLRVLGPAAFAGASLGATFIILVVLNVGMYFFFRRVFQGLDLGGKDPKGK